MAVQPLASYVAEARKFLVGLTGLVLQVIALGVLHGDALHIANVIVAALTAASVYLVPNAISGKKQAEILNGSPGA